MAVSQFRVGPAIGRHFGAQHTRMCWPPEGSVGLLHFRCLGPVLALADHFGTRVWSGLAVSSVVLLLGLPASPSFALPPDPQRPFDAKTCDEAKGRFAQALAGNPLISAEEAADMLALAQEQIRRLCGPDAEIEPTVPFKQRIGRRCAQFHEGKIE
jgi:hypothetical protein